MKENDCVVCGSSFKTRKEHDEHYRKCAAENFNDDDYSDYERFVLIHNEKNY